MNLDIDYMEDEEESDDLGRPLIRNPVVFDAGDETNAPRAAPAPVTPMPLAVQAAQNRDTEDVWAELG